jgi:hypothetical protein
MANEIRISTLDPVATPLYTDVIPDVQLANVGVTTNNISLLKLTQLINASYLEVTASATLASPCPNIVNVNFTTPGQTITLPPATGANGHPAGKPIYFKVAPTNSENFSILTNDGLTTLLTAIGTTGAYNDYIVIYSQNSTQNGTPISLFIIPDVTVYLPLTGGTLSGDLILADADAVGAFSGLDINKSEANSAAQINVYNSFPGAAATAEINAITEGASDAVFRSVINGGDLLAWGLDASDSAAFVLCNTNTLGSGNLFRIGQDGAVNLPLTPFAMAKITATQSNITGDNTTYNITGAIFTELFDQGSNFSNGTFTAPRTGKYRCNLNIVLESIGAAHVFMEVDLVTTGGTYVMSQCNPAAIRTNPGTVNTVSVPASIVVTMTAGDTAYFNIVINGSTKTVGLAGGALYSTMSFKLDA